MQRSRIRYLILLALLVALIVLQVNLWFGSGSLRDGMLLQQKADKLEKKNAKLRHRNQLMEADVHDLKQGNKEVEEIARKDLGMIHKDETFYQILDGKPAKKSSREDATSDEKKAPKKGTRQGQGHDGKQ